MLTLGLALPQSACDMQILIYFQAAAQMQILINILNDVRMMIEDMVAEDNIVSRLEHIIIQCFFVANFFIFLGELAVFVYIRLISFIFNQPTRQHFIYLLWD